MKNNVKCVALIAFVTLLSLSAYASELNQPALQGDWLIVEFQGEPETDGDLWQFEGKRFYQNIGGRRLSPDDFTTRPGVIDLGYAKISVTSFDGKTMEATMAGFKYKLVRQ